MHQPGQVIRSREQGGSGRTGAELLERARRRILSCNGGRPPRLLDPFAGGGAIPLEALRLGCVVESSDLNPVAVLILKGTVDYPQKYGRPLTEQRAQRSRGERDSVAGVDGQVPSCIRESAKQVQSSFAHSDAVAAYERNPLAVDVRYWGNRILERAREELTRFYPPDPDGSVPVAYLWSRTVPCPNCAAEMPLIRQYWLARRDRKRIALRPRVDHESRQVDFDIVEGADVTGDPTEATMSRGDTICLLCRQVAKAEYTRAAGLRGEIGARLTAVVLQAEEGGSKRYRAATAHDRAIFEQAVDRAASLEGEMIGNLPSLPTEPIPYDPFNIKVRLYGMMTWLEVFNARQLVALTTLAQLVRDAHSEMLAAGLDSTYSTAVATYLGLAVGRQANRTSSVAFWNALGEKIEQVFARQAIPIVWDYAESAPLQSTSGGFRGNIDWIAGFIETEAFVASPSLVHSRDVRDISAGRYEVIITDPPYYDSINYAVLSDFFYVWLKRCLSDIEPELFSLPLTPKKTQIVMNANADEAEAGQKGRVAAARERYVQGMGQAFRAMELSLDPTGFVGVVFAHTSQDAWATLLEGLLAAGLIPDASWPIDTERKGKVAGVGQARLQTSVWMACRPRITDAGEAFLGDLMVEMQPIIRERLLYFWSKGIRGADFFISAIGPALSVFGRHTRVLRPDGTEVSVRDFLDLVRRESTQVALEQVLQGADLGVVDPITRQYVTWVWSASRSPLDAGEAIALCLSTGADYWQVVRPGSIAIEAREGSKKVVKLRTIRDRGLQDEHVGLESSARPAPLVDQLQHAAYLWGINLAGDLATYRGQLGETRWAALRTLGQAVAESLPDGDEDRRLILGLLGSRAMAGEVPRGGAAQPTTPTTATLPGFE